MIQVRDEAWRRDAACADADPALFDVAKPNHARAALEYCAACPVRVRCVAARPAGAAGIWGGLVYNKFGRLAIGSGRWQRPAAAEAMRDAS